MKNLDLIAEELFNKIRGRFPSVTIGDDKGNVTNKPNEARFYDFDFMNSGKSLGKVSITLEDNKVGVMYSNDFVTNEDDATKDDWYNFLKELRSFAKKRLLQFDTRNITKSNLNRRDYKFLATQRSGEITMESTMYGTSKTSFQNIGDARLAIKHTQHINQDMPSDRARHISAIYVENSEGERFKYPYRHLSGARAMARHVAEGGNPYDDFGQHITGLSEELGKLRKFKTYLGRSSVMAESLSEYVDVVKERMESIKKDLKNLQKESYYSESVANFEKPVFEDVPDDVKENWIDQLTIKQFNEELADVFPYIYKLVSEATRAKELGPEDLEEGFWGRMTANSIEDWAREYEDGALGNASREFLRMRDQYKGTEWEAQVNCRINSFEDFVNIKERMPQGADGNPIMPQEPMDWLETNGNHKCASAGQSESYEDRIENAFEEMMGQFAEGEECPDCGKNPCSCNEETDEGNKFTAALAKAKANDDDEMEVDGKKIPVTEFVLSYFDRATGKFPKGETAVLTMVEKEYGDEYIEPAKKFIEMVNNRVAEVMGYKDADVEESGLQYHIGKKKYGKEGMAKLAQAGREGASEEELGRIKDEYAKESEDLRRLAGL